MGYQINAFRVPWNTLARVFGSKDKGLARTILRFQDRDGGAYYDDEDTDDAPTLLDALVSVIDGGPFNDEFPEVYVSAVGVLCLHVGEELEPLGISSHDVPVVGAAEQALKDLDAVDRFSIFTLLYRGAPFPIPRCEDRPQIGYMTPAEVEAAHRCFQSLALGSQAPNVRSVLDHMAGWLRDAHEAREGLVCLYD
jgi:hypothetical protein